LSSAVALLSGSLADAQAPASVAAGRKIAEQVCWTCHVVSPTQQFPPMLDRPAPSFAEIAARPNISSPILRHFLTSTHWDQSTIPMSMPSMMLSNDQIGELSAYILSLRERPRP